MFHESQEFKDACDRVLLTRNFNPDIEDLDEFSDEMMSMDDILKIISRYSKETFQQNKK
jgi:hypothetical protein